MSESGFTHFDDSGASHMVDVSAKPVTQRLAVAEGWVVMAPATLRLVLDRQMAKGDVLEVARLAGIMACKRVDALIPLCHTLGLDAAAVAFDCEAASGRIHLTATVKTSGRTGVEMEALTAVTVAALTIYDMCKAVDRTMELGPFRLVEKAGGRSGHFLRANREPNPVS